MTHDSLTSIEDKRAHIHIHTHTFIETDFSVNPPQPLRLIKAQIETFGYIHVSQLLFSFPTKQPFHSFTLWLHIKYSTLQNHYAYISYDNRTGEKQTGSYSGGSSVSVNSVLFSAFS